MLVLDHFVVAGTSRAIATDWVSNTLGELPKVSGKHEYFGTHNDLWGMGQHGTWRLFRLTVLLQSLSSYVGLGLIILRERRVWLVGS